MFSQEQPLFLCFSKYSLIVQLVSAITEDNFARTSRLNYSYLQKRQANSSRAFMGLLIHSLADGRSTCCSSNLYYKR